MKGSAICVLTARCGLLSLLKKGYVQWLPIFSTVTQSTGTRLTGRERSLWAQVINVTPRYAKLKSSDKKEVIGWQNIELISDRPLETMLAEFKRLKEEFPDRCRFPLFMMTTLPPGVSGWWLQGCLALFGRKSVVLPVFGETLSAASCGRLCHFL